MSNCLSKLSVVVDTVEPKRTFYEKNDSKCPYVNKVKVDANKITI